MRPGGGAGATTTPAGDELINEGPQRGTPFVAGRHQCVDLRRLVGDRGPLVADVSTPASVVGYDHEGVGRNLCPMAGHGSTSTSTTGHQRFNGGYQLATDGEEDDKPSSSSST